ncbi:MAG: ABC transporter ATP-binding protein, partial [Caulobacteraceae bacterium]
KEEASSAAPVQNSKNKKNEKKSGPSPSTLRHAVKKAEERMAQLTAEIARIDDDMANASISNPKALEGLTRARAKTQSDLDAAEQAWISAEEALAEVS